MRLCELPCKHHQFKVKAEDTLATAINAMSKGSSVFLVVDNDDRLRGLITTSRVLSLLSALKLSSRLSTYPISLFVNERAIAMHYEYPIEAALQLMVEERKHYIALVKGIKAIGLLSYRCFLSMLFNLKLEIDLEKLASKHIVTLLAHNSLAEAFRAMASIDYYEVPIVEDEIVGILRLRDIISEVLDKGLEKLKVINVYGKCKLLDSKARRFDEVLKLALKEDINLVPLLRSDGSYGFIKLEDLFTHVVAELGAFKVAELIRSNRCAPQSVCGA
ncbi:MAG: CBS domain-containing protein [Candidatus Nezhaarchaeales archaeon]